MLLEGFARCGPWRNYLAVITWNQVCYFRIPDHRCDGVLMRMISDFTRASTRHDNGAITCLISSMSQRYGQSRLLSIRSIIIYARRGDDSISDL